MNEILTHPANLPLPQSHTITKRLRKLPPEATRWMLELSAFPPSDDAIVALEVSDDQFGLVVMSPGTWRAAKAALHAGRYDIAGGGDGS